MVVSGVGKDEELHERVSRWRLAGERLEPIWDCSVRDTLVEEVAVSSLGTVAWFAGRQLLLWVRGAIRSVPIAGVWCRPRFSPDGQLLAVATRADVRVLRVEDARVCARFSAG